MMCSCPFIPFPDDPYFICSECERREEAHTAWEDAPAGDPKMAAWDALCETLDPQVMDAMLHLARLEFRRIERLQPVGLKSASGTLNTNGVSIG